MATTGAVVLLALRGAAQASYMGSTGAVVRIALRTTAGPFGTSDSAALPTLRNWLPPAGIPVHGSDGRVNAQWYRFFDRIANYNLGGPLAPSVTEVTTSVSSVQSAVADTVSAQAAIAQTVVTNAVVLRSVTEVSQAAALPGAEQIPPAEIEIVRPQSGGLLP